MNSSIIKKIIFVGGALVALIFIALLFIFISRVKKETSEDTPSFSSPTRAPVDTRSAIIVSLNPPPTQELLPNQSAQIQIELNSVLASQVNAVVYESSITDKAITTPTPIRQTNMQSVKTIIINSVKPLTFYTLVLTNNNKTLLQQTYISAPPSPSVIPSNNESLKTALPYKGPGYMIEFVESRNIYIIHFRYNAQSDKSFEVQFKEAKTSANNFMRGKGIDLNSVTLEYSYK